MESSSLMAHGHPSWIISWQCRDKEAPVALLALGADGMESCKRKDWLMYCTLRWSNMAMENILFIGDFPYKTSIHRGFSIAMFDYQRVQNEYSVTVHARIENGDNLSWSLLEELKSSLLTLCGFTVGCQTPAACKIQYFLIFCKTILVVCSTNQWSFVVLSILVASNLPINFRWIPPKQLQYGIQILPKLPINCIFQD